MDTFEIIILIAVAFWAGFKICEAWMMLTIRQILQDLGIKEQQLKDLANRKDIPLPMSNESDESHHVVNLKIEQIGPCYYAYSTNDDRFVAQSDSTDGLLERIIEQFPAGTRVVFDRANGGDLMKAAAERLKLQANLSE